MQTLLNILSATPWWIYVLFIVFLYYGYRGLKPNVLSLRQLFLAAFIITLLSIHTLLKNLSLTPTTFTIWILSISAGTLLTITLLHFFIKDTAVDKEHNLVKVKGSWFLLIAIVVIFISKYWLAYLLRAHHQITSYPLFDLILLSVSGICTGFLIGRFSFHYYHYRKARRDTDLKKAG